MYVCLMRNETTTADDESVEKHAFNERRRMYVRAGRICFDGHDLIAQSYTIYAILPAVVGRRRRL